MDSTLLVERLGDARAAEVWAEHDSRARDLLARYRGREIDRTDGFFLLFDDAGDAARYALAYHGALAELDLNARAGLHVGPVTLRENAPEAVARGAKRTEVEGLAKPLAARIMALARGGQTLLSAAARSALGAALPAGAEMESHGHRVGRMEEARVHYEAALAIHRAVGNRRFEGVAQGDLADLLVEQGRIGRAREALQAGEALLREIGDRLELAKLLCIRGRVEATAGDLDLARSALAEAETVAAAIGAGPDSALGREIARLRAALA